MSRKKFFKVHTLNTLNVIHIISKVINRISLHYNLTIQYKILLTFRHTPTNQLRPSLPLSVLCDCNSLRRSMWTGALNVLVRMDDVNAVPLDSMHVYNSIWYHYCCRLSHYSILQYDKDDSEILKVHETL